MIKSQKTVHSLRKPEKDVGLSRQLIDNFGSLDQDQQLKTRILGAGEDCIQMDTQLLALALRQQASLYVHQARLLFYQCKLCPL